MLNTMSKSSVKIKTFMMEIFAVIIGVLIAFYFDNLNDEIKDDELRQFYHSELRLNLENDRKQLDYVIESQSNNLTILHQILTEQINMKNIDSLFAKTISNETFYPTMGAYRAMVAEGSLSLIEDKRVTSAIVDLYEFNYERAVYLGTVLDTEVARFVWEIKADYSLIFSKFRNKNRINTALFKSLIEHRIAYIQLYVEHVKKTRDKIDKVLTILVI